MVDLFDVFHTCVMSLLAFLVIHLICHHGDGSIGRILYGNCINYTFKVSLRSSMTNNLRLVHNRLLSLTNMYLVFEPPLNEGKQSISTRFGQQANFSYGSLHWELLWHHNGDGDAEFSQGGKRK